MDAGRIGQAIQFLRKRAGYTQMELADRLLVSDKAVSRWERGKGVPDISLLKRLSIILDTDIDSLLEGSVAVHENSWKGLLLADFPVDTPIFDKPLSDYLLSYFLLAKVRDIIIFSKKQQIDFLKARYGNGDELNISLTYCEMAEDKLSISIDKHKELFASSSVMAIYEPCVLYGVDLTRFLRRGMLNEEKVTALLTVKNDPAEEVFIGEDRIIAAKIADDTVPTHYHYCRLPFLYSHAGIKGLLGRYSSFRELSAQLIEKKELAAELMDKGFVDFTVDTPDSVLAASGFISIVQKQTACLVCDPKEIAFRRGLIGEEQLANRRL